MLQGVVLGMLLRVVGLGKMVTMHKKFRKRKTTMELTRMQKMELTMEMVSKTNSICCVVSMRIFTRCLYFDSPDRLVKIQHNSYKYSAILHNKSLIRYIDITAGTLITKRILFHAKPISECFGHVV